MYFDPQDTQWLRTFGAGLLTGCGLTSAGAAGEEDGESLGLHGRAVAPARPARFYQ